MKIFHILIALICLAPAVRAETKTNVAPGELSIREIRYDAQLTADEARFAVRVDAESTGNTSTALPLFVGEVAVLPAKLPTGLAIVREDSGYVLKAARAGKYSFTLDIVARIKRAEPWNEITFTGPPAAIATLTAQASGAGMEVQLQSGTLIESAQTNALAHVRGLIAADRAVKLRWQGKVAEVARKALITADTAAAAQITPTVIKYTTQIRYDLVQGHTPRLTLALPAAHALTRLAGEQIRDWQVKTDGDRQILTVEFIKPIEKNYNLTVYSEQSIEPGGAAAQLNPPQPLDIERESGSFTVTTEDMVVETDSLAGLRQVNAAAGVLAAYRFNARPFTLALRLRRIEPVINVNDRVTIRLEETRLLVSHSLALNIEKAGIYAVELPVQPGFVVADVRGEGVEDWKSAAGKIRVNFSARVLGARKLDVQLEQALKQFPEQIAIAPLRVTGATKESAQIGAASAPGIRLKSGELAGLREIPANRLANHTDELLAFTAEQPDWKLVLASERLAPRVVAEVFNLVTIGDGIVGGSATIRYGIINQGVQEFKVKLPAHCKNVEFTGPNIRRKELQGDVWTIGLQDKAWGGYTLVVTYDFQFDPKGATLSAGGIHTVGVERETGSIAMTTAASLKLTPKTAGETLHRVDEAELTATDRALVTRAVVLAYQYAEGDYNLAVEVQRHEELPVLEAVADRTQITSVLTEAGEMLSQASFMVKNNEKQFQKFKLPAGADFWGCYVNGQAAKPERDGDWVLVPLPRDTNRDQAFAVDIVYAEKMAALKSRWPHTVTLVAPHTDVPNTYAEWQLYAPTTRRLYDFGGSMSVAEGTTYGVLDAWQKFLAFYGEVLREAGGALFVIGLLTFLVIVLVISAARRGWSGVITLLGVFCILGILAGMLLPALGKAKSKAQRIKSVSNLKQVGLAVRMFANDNEDRLPMTFDEMMNELGDPKITYDVESGQRYTYLGAGLKLDDIRPDSVIAYSPLFNNQCNVLFADGSVQMISASKFAELSQRGLVQRATPAEIAGREQAQAVARKQMEPRSEPPILSGSPVNRTAPATRMTINNGMIDQRQHAGEISSGDGLTIGGNVDVSVDKSGYAVATGLTPLPAAPMATPPPAPPKAKGLRSIRIEIPREGNSFLFTKVLNVSDEPLSVSTRVMSLETFQTLQMCGQLAAFLIGLGVCGWQWRRPHPNTFILAVALTLVIVSVASLLIAWRALHDLLIVGLPIVVLAIVARLTWKLFARRAPKTETATAPPVIAAIALLFSLGLATAGAADVVNVSILSANYTGTVNDRVAQLDATLQLSAASAGQAIVLFGDDVALQQFTVKTGDPKLVRDGNRVLARLGRAGAATVQVKFVTKTGGDVSRRQLAFNIPPALSSQVQLTLDQPDAEVDFPSAISFKRATDKGATRVDAIIGSGARVEMLWTPRIKRAADTAATIFCQSASLVTFGGGVVNTRATLDYQITQGELRQVRVRLPAGQRLLRVEGDAIRTWEIKDENGAPTLVVELLKGMSPNYRLTVETEKPLDALPASVALDTPHTLDVKRETGLIALRGAEELTLAVEAAKELQRVDAEEFARASGGKSDGLTSVFRFLKPEFELRAHAETVQAEIEAVVQNSVRVTAEQMTARATIDYTIKRAGVFALRVALPADYRVEQVTGAGQPQWSERTNADGRVLEIALKERASGGYTLVVELTKAFKQLPKSLAIAGVHPLDAAKLTGFVSVQADAGVAVKTEAFDGLSEIPAVALPGGGQPSASTALAYKFIATTPQAGAPWKLAVTTETVEAWVRAETVQTFTVGEALVSGRALVRYDIANAPVKELRLKIPAAFKNVEISGANIRRRDQQGDSWRVELQNKVRGSYTLTVTWDHPRTTKTNGVALAGISAEGVERETGLLTVVAKSPLQVTESQAMELKRVDAREFPDWAGKADDATVLAYRYARPGYALAVEARRFDEAQVLQALLDSVRFTTVVADDGQVMTEMALAVRNNGRQFLEVELPADAKVWSAFIAGQPVRPSRRDGKLLLPLQDAGAGDEAVAVELTYVGRNPFPRIRGAVDFVSPKFDVPLKNARWELYLPPGYDYAEFSGTMAREAASLPSVLSFGSLEYSQMEKQSRAVAKAEAKKDVSYAESNLRSGNFQQAVWGLNRARAKQLTGDKESDTGVVELEKSLRNAQASNLINAQQDFFLRNNGSGRGGGGGQEQSMVNAPVDNAAAEAQWTKLAAAQEIAAVKVQPLHINLPLRGLRCAFTQVLQTEVNKPMTIRLAATNNRTGNWLSRGAMALTGFGALWAGVAFAAARRRKHA